MLFTPRLFRLPNTLGALNSIAGLHLYTTKPGELQFYTWRLLLDPCELGFMM